MASNLKRSKRTIGRRISNLESRTRRLQKRPARTSIAPRTVVASNIAQGAVSSAELSSTVTTSISTAQATADGKNKIYRQTTEPTGGTYVDGDLWFDTDDNNKIYRRASGAWAAVQLGGNALANINANAITAGTIDASVITVSNINAGNISTGSINSIAFTGYAGNFAVDANGNAKQNNILASGPGATAQGLQILANGASQGSLTASNGSIYIFAADNGQRGATSDGGIRIGTVASHLKISKGTSPSSVFIQPSVGTYNDTTKTYTFSENHNLELYCNPNYSIYCNQDFVLRGTAAVDGSGNDYFADNPSSANGQPAGWYQPAGSPKAQYVIVIDTSSINTKENVAQVHSTEALDIISRLSVKKFTHKRASADTDLSYAMKQQDYVYGFIAEEIAEVAPELAIKTLDKEGNEMAISGEITIDNIYSSEHYKPANWKRDSVTALLVSAVQELTAKVAQLESQISPQ